MSKFYITTPIYYASGEPHIGSAFTTIFADVIARYERAKNKDVFFLTGLDEYGAKIEAAAQAAGKSPQDFVEALAEKYRYLWRKLQIQNDGFIRTTSPQHKESVYKFFERLKKSGDISEGFYEGLYCIGCEDFILERNLISDGLCPDHLIKPELIKEKNYFFNLKKYLPLVKEKILSGELAIIPASRKNESLKILDEKINDFSVSREKVKWGIPYPDDDSQTIYVWVEALINYLSALDFPDGKNYKKFWPPDVHIIGAEINKFHTIFWPALLLSAQIPLPKKIFIHGLFTINGQKMSKALGNVINPLDLIKKFGSDATRYLLLSQFPATEHSDIKENNFTEKYNADLANGIGNLFERTAALIIKYNGFRKTAEITDAPIDSEVKEFIKKNEEQYNLHLENFELYEALQETFRLAKFLDKYLNNKAPWKLIGPNQYEYKNHYGISEILNSTIFGIEKIIEFLAPFMPTKMTEAKNYFTRIKNEDGGIGANKKLNLFPRI